MSDTFDRLLGTLNKPQRFDEPERGTIVIDGLDPDRSFIQHACLVRIDGRGIAYLSQLRSTISIEVDVGDHHVSVQLGPDRAGPLSVRVEPGERVELVCGKKAEWINLERRMMRLFLLLFFPSYGMMALG